MGVGTPFSPLVRRNLSTGNLGGVSVFELLQVYRSVGLTDPPCDPFDLAHAILLFLLERPFELVTLGRLLARLFAFQERV
mmetsp:Transcript_28405/g.27362  ORF Transcript_28405/g.27362 Transcript_28405/m.27362 type:complete len:80 (-) Transcript_28405:1373-1612(-)